MESMIFDYLAIRESEEFAIKRYLNAVYKGQVTPEGKRNGKGIMLYQNRIYEGGWSID